MKRLRIHVWMPLLAALVLSAPGARAQDQQQDSNTQTTDPSTAPITPLPAQDNSDNGPRQVPAPAGRAFSIFGSQDGADDHTLLGTEIIGLGSESGSTTTFDPAYRFSEGVDNGVVQGHVDSITSLGGSFGMDQQWERYRLIVQYSGAMIFYSPDSTFSEPYHNFAIAQDIRWKRIVFRLRDNVNVSPEANFGGLYTGVAGLAGQPSLLTGLAPTITLGETIQTGQVNQVSNVAVGEFDFLLSRRSTVSVSGSYSLLQYLTSGFIDDHQSNGGLAYNYALSARNTVALAYSFNHINYTGAGGGATQTQLVQLGFGRKINGRLGFQLSAGPQFIQNLGTGLPGSSYWTWSLSGSAVYALTRATNANIYYSHIASNGSGVFSGSEDDTVTAGINHRFTRFLTMYVNAGYAFTNNLVPVGTATSHYGNWYAGLSLDRQIGREIHVNANYAFQQQNSGFGTCPVLSCGFPVANRSIATVAVEWHPWAIQQPR